MCRNIGQQLRTREAYAPRNVALRVAHGSSNSCCWYKINYAEGVAEDDDVNIQPITRADFVPAKVFRSRSMNTRAAKGFDIRHNTVRAMLKSDNGARERST